MEHGQANGKEEAPQTVGAMLRQAREARSLSREHVSQRTRIAERHLRAIEEDRLFDLAGRTYAIGFSRAFAREVGLDEAMVADAVRAQLDRDERARPRAQPETFEPGDPSRVPSARLAWTTAVLGVLVIVVALAFLWPSFLAPQGRLPDLLSESEQPRPADSPAAAPTAPDSPSVIFTATAPQVWLSISDGAGNPLFEKEMAEGESYTLPPGIENPLLRTARPDALEITIGGKRVPRLSDRPELLSNVPVSARALLSRDKAAPTAANPPAPGHSPAAAGGRPVAPRSAPEPAQAPRVAPLPAARTLASPPAPDTQPAPSVEAISTVSAPDSTDSD